MAPDIKIKWQVEKATGNLKTWCAKIIFIESFAIVSANACNLFIERFI